MSRLAFYTFGIMHRTEDMSKDFSELRAEIPNVFKNAVESLGYIEPVLGTGDAKPMPRFYKPDKHLDALVILSI